MRRARPELLDVDAPPLRETLTLGLVVSLGLVVFLAPFASPLPDGLEKVAQSLGFEHRAADPVLPAPLPDYAMPGVASGTFSTIVAGLAGTLTVFVLAWAAARAIRSRGAPQTAASPPPAGD